MIFQRIDAWGDSMTFGARTYGCYPMHMARRLREETGYEWLVRNKGVNGNTARDLWFRVANTVAEDVQAACVLIGTNDAKQLTRQSDYEEYLYQTLVMLRAHGWKVFLGTIPLIAPKGRLPYTMESERHRQLLNVSIEMLARSMSGVTLVELHVVGDHLCDGVHLNEDGNKKVAEAFAGAILEA